VVAELRRRKPRMQELEKKPDRALPGRINEQPAGGEQGCSHGKRTVASLRVCDIRDDVGADLSMQH
jgi:hypothetical protein